ncbi:MAG: DinB family protein [Candidatus Eisenbacteria bacterium]|uniref:DinB family protein n=1 Tax=Eiseniibacteriota bacterium TaxID=2212470 RepID=A0A956LZM1_UNCEI|nr:DinB family protein [Candidatus Eisenbacteria bacterium]
MEEDALREQLVRLLRGGDSHGPLEASLREFPAKYANTKVDSIPHNAWQLLEHMRIAQWDILEFSRNPGHVSPRWPEGYWPESKTASSVEDWNESIDWFCADLEEMITLVNNPATDFFGEIPHGDGETLLREVQVLAAHNSYHLGQIFLLRRAVENKS